MFIKALRYGEGLNIVLIAVHIFVLAFGGTYTAYLNPRFEVFTMISAGLLLFLGLYKLVYPPKETNFGYLALYVLLLLLCYFVPVKTLGVPDLIQTPF